MSSKCKILRFCSEVKFVTPTDIAMTVAGEIGAKCCEVDNNIKNKAELYYCVGDPILHAICSTWGYKVHLEESVKQQREHIQVSFLHHHSMYNVFLCLYI